jgi:hypothetical protein
MRKVSRNRWLVRVTIAIFLAQIASAILVMAMQARTYASPAVSHQLLYWIVKVVVFFFDPINLVLLLICVAVVAAVDGALNPKLNAGDTTPDSEAV